MSQTSTTPPVQSRPLQHEQQSSWRRRLPWMVFLLLPFTILAMPLQWQLAALLLRPQGPPGLPTAPSAAPSASSSTPTATASASSGGTASAGVAMMTLHSTHTSVRVPEDWTGYVEEPRDGSGKLQNAYFHGAADTTSSAPGRFSLVAEAQPSGPTDVSTQRQVLKQVADKVEGQSLAQWGKLTRDVGCAGSWSSKEPYARRTIGNVESVLVAGSCRAGDGMPVTVFWIFGFGPDGRVREFHAAFRQAQESALPQIAAIANSMRAKA